MSSSSHTQQALWLDPFRALGVAEQAQLGVAGLTVRPVNTLEELQAHLLQADCLVIRLGANLELLHELLRMMKKMDHLIPVVCRVERQALGMAVAAMREGATHVLAADEWSVKEWLGALAQTKPLQMPNAAEPKRTPAPRSVVYVDPVSRHLLALRGALLAEGWGRLQWRRCCCWRLPCWRLMRLAFESGIWISVEFTTLLL